MKLLITTDGSKNAENAAQLVARLPHDEQLHITILYANNLIDFHGVQTAAEVLQQCQEEDRKRGADSCLKIAKMFEGSNATVTSKVVEGHPSVTIVQQAEELGVDLVVMGAVGLSRLERIVLGSTSDFVATHAPCSVLVVRPQLTEELKLHEPRVCIAYDNSEPCRAAIDGFSHFAWVKKTAIDLLSIIPTPFIYSDIPIQIDRTASQQSALAQLDSGAELCAKISPKVKTHLIESDYVGDGIVKFAGDNSLDMVVLGDTGRGLFGRFFLGSVSRYVLRHAECSVWIGRLKKGR
ncbi:MAG: universal stress protein [Pirellula sp.]|jgi:nucleotide-binding universal stress UspA family protein|nr:universal stress protein [Pirellula sp.]